MLDTLKVGVATLNQGGQQEFLCSRQHLGANGVYHNSFGSWDSLERKVLALWALTRLPLEHTG